MKKSGFSLAEIIITLGIIGVVTALTIPNLVNNYKKKVYAKSLAAAVSNFEVAMQSYLQKEGVEDLWDTSAWMDENGNPILMDEDSDSMNIASKNFASEISKVLSLTADGDSAGVYSGITIKTLSGDSANFEPLYKRKIFLSKNNVAYHIQILSSNDQDSHPHNLFKASDLSLIKEGINLSKIAAEVTIDINSTDAPNVFGRDIFQYWLGADGKLYPYHSKDYSRFLFLRDGAVTGSTYTNPEVECKANNSNYCGAYLQENGYDMDY